MTHVAILLCTKNGAAFLSKQLESLACQRHKNWSLIVSDDGSGDDTKGIVLGFADKQSQEISFRAGPGRGACANFLSLACDPTISADFFAFSDQDDVWYDDKLGRALEWLTTTPEHLPCLYCAPTELVDADGNSRGLSPKFPRPPSFRNALVQNIGGANTMVFNKAAKKLLEAAGVQDVVMHDWWVYQLVTAAGGQVHFDTSPVLKYRQHRNNLIGSNRGWGPAVARLRMLLRGRFRDWNATNIAALRRVPAHLITPENRTVLDAFAAARSGSFIERLRNLRRSGVYRQRWRGNLTLLLGTVMRKI